jgi:pimeloyl-ACP methyl ester carboxylesterase
MSLPTESAVAADPLDARALAAADLFVRPRRRVEAEAPPTAAPARWLNLPAGELRWWVEGDGAPVLLVHGWEGQPNDLRAVADALRARSQAVAWIELPAHGGSTIEWTSVPHAALALEALGAELGPLRGVIAHSVGGALAALALGHPLRASRVCLIAAPAEYSDYVRAFAGRIGLGEAGVAALLRALRERYGIDAERVSTPAAARAVDAAALLIHSRDDTVVPFRDAEVIAAAWPGARLMSVEGLGHRRLLDDAAVVGAAVSHVLGSTIAQDDGT